MIINSSDNADNLHFNEEVIRESSGYVKSDSLQLISQLANDLYRQDIVGDIPKKYVPDKYNHQQIKPSINDLDLSNKRTEKAINHAENEYYFLKEYRPTNHTDTDYYSSGYDVYAIRKDFPILQRRINGKPLIWLDNSATTQKPICVINELNRFYSEYNSNIHRGAHTLAKLATNAYEAAREKVQRFIGAQSAEEIVFVRGTTEAINLVAESFGGLKIHTGDEIILSLMEHHSNIVPWQKLQQEKGAVIKVVPVNDRGEIILEEYEKLFTAKTRLVAITHVSNVLGTVNPVRIMTEIAHKHGAYVLIDGAQSVPHTGVDMRELDADFFAFSGHKIYGPTGIGVLYGKKALLEEMPPWQRGGGMITNVSFTETTYNSLPYKFEAGTGNIADAVGLGEAVEYMSKIGMSNVEEHERKLTVYAMEKLYQIPGVHLIGTAPEKTSVISFVIDGISPENTALFLNQDGIAVRAGHHCAQPILRRFGLNSSIRASLGIYNTTEEVDCLFSSVLKIAKYYS